MISAREKILVEGIDDWVKVYQVHRQVASEHPEAPLETVQHFTLELITGLAQEQLIELGELHDHGARFVAWDGSIDESVQRIRTEYVGRFNDATGWPWTLFFRVTDTGKRVARAALPEYQQWLAELREQGREYESIPRHLEPA